MREPKNIQAVSALAPDLMGFIFYPKSPRYITESMLPDALGSISPGISPVAVFVNEAIETATRICANYGFSFAQLHGADPPAYCASLREQGIGIIKAFAVDEAFDLDQLAPYTSVVDFFLFDTRTSQYGGSGKQFDWWLLQSYPYPTPYFLSGGISAEDIQVIKTMHLPGMAGIDANSKLEISPALKDIEKTRTLIHQIRKT